MKKKIDYLKIHGFKSFIPYMIKFNVEIFKEQALSFQLLTLNFIMNLGKQYENF